MAENDKPTSIVVAVDFDESGATALRCAYQLAVRHAPCELHVVNVLSDRERDVGKLSDALPEAMAQLQAHVTAVLAELAAQVAADIEPKGHIRIGPYARAIHQCASDVSADLIVVGTHNRRGLERIVVGSVSEELLRIAHAPVVVARDKSYRQQGHSERPEAPREGQDMQSQSLTDRLVLRHVDRKSHIPGLL